MQSNQPDNSLQALQDIRSIMERSARFLSLSGWSGVWAGSTALAGAYAAYKWLTLDMLSYNYMLQPKAEGDRPSALWGAAFYKPFALGTLIFLIAFAGAYYFTWRKVKRQGGNLRNPASRSMLRSMFVPLLAGAVFCIGFMRYGDAMYIAPACLIFYGLSLINGSKYTLSEIRYLGMLEATLGAICLFVPGFGLLFWAFGFGILHIFYGIIMWRKYDREQAE